jgi:hypothetical protein
MNQDTRYVSCRACSRCGRYGEQVWISRAEGTCQMCRNVSPEVIAWFAQHVDIARKCKSLGTPCPQVLDAARDSLALVLTRRSEDPISAAPAIRAWLDVLDDDSPLRVCNTGLLPSEAFLIDTDYLRARMLTARDAEGPLPIPGVKFACGGCGHTGC